MRASNPVQTPRMLLCAAALAACAASAQAQSVAMSGMMGSKPLLVVNGAPPKTVGVGETYMGVKVLSAAGDHATVQSEGKRFTVRLGESPVNLGGSAAPAGEAETGGDGRKIIMTQSGGGHFSGNGSINGKTMRFMVDTGATYVALGVGDAERMGINYKSGPRMAMQTANGVNMAWVVKLNSVRIGGVQVHDVDAVVSPANMGFVLLGNSFLNRFAMTRDGDRMILERRY